MSREPSLAERGPVSFPPRDKFLVLWSSSWFFGSDVFHLGIPYSYCFCSSVERRII